MAATVIQMPGEDSVQSTDPGVPLNRTIGLFGDSKAALSFASVTNGNILSKAFGLASWIQTWSQGRVHAPLANNFGIAGQTSAEILLRQRAVLLDPVNANVDVWVVICGSNDRRSPMTLEQSQKNVRAICRNFREAGKHVVFITETPNGPGGGNLSDDQQAIHYAYHLWAMNDLPNEVPGVLVANPWEDMENLATTRREPLPGLTRDGVHWTIRGAEIVGRHVWNAMRHLFPGPADWFTTNLLYDAAKCPTGSLNLNPALLYTGGTLNANVPVPAGTTAAQMPGSMQLYGDGAGPQGAVITPSMEVDTDGVTWFKLSVKGKIPNANSKEILLRTTGPLQNMVAGDRIRSQVRVKHRGVGMASINLSLIPSRGASPGFYRVYTDHDPYELTDTYPTRLMEGSRETPVYVHNEGAEDISNRFAIVCQPDVDLNFEVWLTSFATTKLFGL